MNWLITFLQNLLLRTPREILMALLRLLFIIVVLVLVILMKLLEWLLAALRSKHLYEEEVKDPCGQLPEAIIRRPDPCIYSQRLLQSQNLPVTWNNPDIWAAPADNPGQIEPDSYHLEADKDYLVSVRVHNASTDPAIGARVRLNYRPWSFNSPELTPIETDSNGQEVVRFVHVPAMSSAITTFKWHTPVVPAGQQSKHFCLQASLYHPMDTNTANNMGQENTNVWRTDNPGFVAAGDIARVEIPLFNFARKAQAFRFAAIQYQIGEEKNMELTLKTTRGYARRSLLQRTANWVPSLKPTSRPMVQIRTGDNTEKTVERPGFREQFSFKSLPDFVGVKNQYVGFDELRRELLSGDYSLPKGMEITAAGQPLEEAINIEGKQEQTIAFDIKTPADAMPGNTIPVVLMAFDKNDVLQGGVTVLLTIREN